MARSPLDNAEQHGIWMEDGAKHVRVAGVHALEILGEKFKNAEMRLHSEPVTERPCAVMAGNKRIDGATKMSSLPGFKRCARTVLTPLESCVPERLACPVQRSYLGCGTVSITRV